MTDQTGHDVTDDECRLARDWAEHIISAPETSLPMETAAARVLLAVLPKRPTLADMTMEERLACRRMQADVEGRDRRPVIVNPYWEDGTARVMWPHGFIEEIAWERITPRPDLARLEWPGDKQPAPEPAPEPALPAGWRPAKHQTYGRVLVVRTDGESAIYATPYKATGIRTRACMASRLTFVDTEPEEA